MLNGGQQSPSTQTELKGRSENGTMPEGQLSRTENPALARLASAVRGRAAGESPENYSRMHHRHNRS